MVEKLACSGCGVDQIAAILNCNERTIQRRFATLLKRGHQRRNGRLQVELYRRAMKGSDAIAIFLAKNWLGMTDRPDVVVNVQQNAVYAELTREQLLASIARAKALEAEAPIGWQPPALSDTSSEAAG
jgi:hypothetical protein